MDGAVGDLGHTRGAVMPWRAPRRPEVTSLSLKKRMGLPSASWMWFASSTQNEFDRLIVREPALNEDKCGVLSAILTGDRDRRVEGLRSQYSL